MDLFDAFRAVPWFYLCTAIVLGLLVGSFLNVVIHRLPKMMETDWRQQCIEFLHPEQAITAAPQVSVPKYNLVIPRSACPACGHQIRAIENIPVVSYLALRGKCSACGVKISARYPAVEALTGLWECLHHQFQRGREQERIANLILLHQSERALGVEASAITDDRLSEVQRWQQCIHETPGPRPVGRRPEQVARLGKAIV